MITLSILFIFSGSYLLYGTSKTAMLNSTSIINVWISSYIKTSKIIGVILFAISLTGAIYNFGFTTGILFWLFVLTSVLGLIIIITPLQKITYKHSLVLFVAVLTLEFII